MVTHDTNTVHPVHLPGGTPVPLTLHEYGGSRDGPTLFVQAAQHGTEINGIEVLRQLHDTILTDYEELTGTLITLPISNPIPVSLQSQTTPDALDSHKPNMNRCWPGNPTGSIHEQVASVIWEYVQQSDYVVDVHSALGNSLSHVIYSAGDPDARRLAEAFGTRLHRTPVTPDRASEDWENGTYAGSLRVAASLAGIPCITPELGDSYHLQDTAVQTGVTGLLGIIRELEILSGEVSTVQPLVRAKEVRRVTAGESGIFRPHPNSSPGTQVESGDHLGTLYAPDTFAELERVTANTTGLLYALTNRGTVAAGDRLVSIAKG